MVAAVMAIGGKGEAEGIEMARASAKTAAAEIMGLELLSRRGGKLRFHGKLKTLSFGGFNNGVSKAFGGVDQEFLFNFLITFHFLSILATSAFWQSLRRNGGFVCII